MKLAKAGVLADVLRAAVRSDLSDAEGRAWRSLCGSCFVKLP